MAVSLGSQGVDSCVHFVCFGGFFGKGLLVGVGFDLEDFDVFLFHSLILFGGVSGGIFMRISGAFLP